MHFPPGLPYLFARIVEQSGPQKTAALVNALQSSDPVTRQLASQTLAILHARRDMLSVGESLAYDLASYDPRVRGRALYEVARLAEADSPIVDEVIGICEEAAGDEEWIIGAGMPEIVGFSLKSIVKKVKKVAKKVKNVKQAVKKVKAAAKAIKKHNFKKDIHALNKIGKVVGPIAAAAPPPYGPAISAGLTVVNMADKYNQGTLSADDAAAVADVLKETGVEEALASTGIKESQIFTDIMKVAKTAKNASKAQELIVKANSGDKKAITKIATVKRDAQSGNPVAIATLDAIDSANKGSKLPPEKVRTLVQSVAPSPARAPMIRIARKAPTMYTPAGQAYKVIPRGSAGVASEIAIAMRRQ